MNKLLPLLVVALVAANEPRVFWEEAPELSLGWFRGEYARPEEPITLYIALKHGQEGALEESAHAVSDPRSPKYGQHLTTKQIAQLVAPSMTTLEAAAHWLEGVEYTFGATGDIITIKTTVEVVERLFATRVHHVSNAHTQQKGLRAEETSIPRSLDGHITAAFGLYGLPLPKPDPIRRAAPGQPASVTPKIIHQVYNISGVTPTGTTKNLQAVAEFQGEFMSTTDLATFFQKYVPNAKPGDDKVYKFVGPNDPSRSGEGIEALLDIQFIMGVAPGIKTEFWIYPAQNFCSDLVGWTEAILADSNAPNVFSVSYGWQGNLTQVGCTTKDVQTVDLEFQKLANAGKSIIFASGDSGSGYNPFEFCGQIKPNTQYTGELIKTLEHVQLEECCQNCTAGSCGGWTYAMQNLTCKLYNNPTPHPKNFELSGTPATPPKLYPSWPASSPWVTAVGSTRFIDQTPGKGEQSTDQFGSGSGFSSMFKMPTWQKAAQETYFKEEPSSKLPPSDLWSRGGRGTPDVAALGEGFQVIVQGHVEPVGGTSASTPTFSAVISLINDKRISAGKKPLGYLNHWIYQENNNMLRDVTVGNDRVGRGGEKLQYGFDCQKGWDPVSGWGSPDFPKMLQAAMKLP